MNSLTGGQGGIFSGVGNMAQAVEYRLTENVGSRNKKEQVLTTMYTDVPKIIQELGLSREETLQTNKGLVAMGQKMDGFGRKH